MGTLDCNFCGEELRLRQQPPWRYSCRTIGLFVVAGTVGVVGIPLLLFALSQVTEVHSAIGQPTMVVGAMAALAVAYYGHGLPRVRTVRCSACGVPERVSSKPQRDDSILENVRADLGRSGATSTDEVQMDESESQRRELKTRMRRNKRKRAKD